jgi:hypothetical protein
MTQGLLWLPLLLVFVLLTGLGWLERRRQQLFRDWAEGAELAKLDGCGAARLIDGELSWSTFEAGSFQPVGSFPIKQLELVELLALSCQYRINYLMLACEGALCRLADAFNVCTLLQ